MEEEELQPNNNFDFGGYFDHSIGQGNQFNPLEVAKAVSDIRKENPLLKVEFTDESFNNLKNKYGEEVAEQAKDMYSKTLELSSVQDRNRIFKPQVLDSSQSRAEGFTHFKEAELKDMKPDPVFRHNSFFRPFQYKTYQQAAEANRNYFSKDEDGNYVKKKLKESEDYNDIANPWSIGFGGESLVVATNDFVAKNIDPSLQEKIDNGEVSAEAYYTDEDGNYAYRSLDDGEENIDKVRSIFGPEDIYTSGFWAESAKGFYDGLLGLVEGAGTIGYYGTKYTYAPLKLVGFNKLDNYFNERFADFVNTTARLKSTTSVEEDLGWNHSLSNFSKAAFNGVGQIAGTFGAGLGVNIGLKGVSYLSNAARLGNLSKGFLADVPGGVTRALNFGIAAKAGKEEAMRAGLSHTESDMIGLITGGIMLGTEYLTGSQFIPKAVGRDTYKEISKKVTANFVEEAKRLGISVSEYVGKNPGKIKNAVYNAHKWLEAPASNRLGGFAKGFAGESMQETLEDLTANLVQEGYDLLVGEKKFDNDWNEVWNDLAGSFWIGGVSGGLVKSITTSKRVRERDAVDEKRNGFIIDEITKGNYDLLIKAINDTFEKEGLGSKIVSANRDAQGRKMPASKDKGLNGMSENEFFKKVYTEQVTFAKKVHDQLQGKFATRQQLADKMYQYMGQNLTDITTDIDAMAKGVQMAMQTEGMQLFREESLLRGHIALNVAKSKNASIDSWDAIGEVRFFNGKVLAVKKNGEFVPPTVEEETALNQAHQEVFSGGDTGQGLEDLAMRIKDREKQLSEFNFQLERLALKGEDHPQYQEINQQMDELLAEQQKDMADFKATLKDRGLDMELAEDMVELTYMGEFKDKLLDGSRTDRYVRNFALNVTKEKFKSYFPEGVKYDIEDYDLDERKERFFTEAFSQEQELLSNLAVENEQAIGDILASNIPVSEKMQSLKTFLDDKGHFTQNALIQVNDFIDSINYSMTDSQKDRFNNQKSKFADLMRVNEIFDEMIAMNLELLGPDALFNHVATNEIDVVTEGIALSDLLAVKDSLLSKTAEFPDAQDEINSIFMQADEFIDNLSRQAILKTKEGLNALSKSKKVFVPGDMDNSVFSYGVNQNRAFKDNFVESESGIKDGIDKLKGIGNEFIDNGEIGGLRKEIQANYRYMVGRLAAITNDPERNGQLPVVMEVVEALEGYLAELDNLQLLSDTNRGNRFDRDYEIKSSVIKNALIHLSSIIDLLGLDLKDQLDTLIEDHPLTPEGKALIDEQYKAMQELEVIVSEAVRNLGDVDLDTLMENMGLLDFKYEHKANSKFEYLFKSNHEDQESPFNSKSDRDLVEAKLNYLLMLGRGNLREFWNYTNEHLETLELDKTLIPSQEQLFVTKQLFTKLAAEGKSNVDRAVQRHFKEDEYDFLNEGIFVRGIGGAGKSSFVVNLAFDIISRYNRDVKKETGVLYSAPTDDQVENIGNSFAKIKAGILAEPFSRKNIAKIFKGDKSNNGLNGVQYVVIDEATVFDTDINIIVNAIKAHNASDANINKVKLVLIGDEFQNTGSTNRPLIYGKNFYSFVERTVPLTTPYRSGKVESFDLQKAHRNMLSTLLSLSAIKPSSKTDFIIPVTNEVVTIDSDDAKQEAYQKVVQAMLPRKSTTYLEEKGVVKKGLRAMSDRSLIVEAFAKDIGLNITTDDSDMVFISDNPEQVVDEVKTLLDQKGITITRAEIQEKVRSSKSAQGLQFNRVYTDIYPDVMGSKLAGYILAFRSMYVAESREREALIFLDPEKRINSQPVVSKDSIAMFSDLNFKQKDASENLIGDSLALFENNQHIAAVVSELSEEKPVKNADPDLNVTDDVDTDAGEVQEAESTEEANNPETLTPEAMDDESKAIVNEETKKMTMDDLREYSKKTSLEDSRRHAAELDDSVLTELCD